MVTIDNPTQALSPLLTSHPSDDVPASLLDAVFAWIEYVRKVSNFLDEEKYFSSPSKYSGMTFTATLEVCSAFKVTCTVATV